MERDSATAGLPVPRSDERNQAFWAAAQRGSLVIARCLSCGNLEAPPISNCRRCLGETFEWITARGGGTLYSFIEYHKAWTDEWKEHTPYTVAIIDLDEGLRMVSGLVADEAGELPGVGDRVQVVFQQRGADSRVPMFRRAA